MEEQSVWRRRRRRSNGRAVMRCVPDAFSDCTVLAGAPVNHNYNCEERWEQWCRKSRSDNYNARDKIMGTRCTLPIISCISCWLTHPHPTYPHWQPAITGHICEIQNELIWWQRWGLWSVSVFACVCLCAWFCQMSKNIYFSLPFFLAKISIAWHGITKTAWRRNGPWAQHYRQLVMCGSHKASPSLQWKEITFVLTPLWN